jgi:FolB domain-containing protein
MTSSMEWPPAKPDRDIVFIENLNITATIGPDCWKRSKAQPLLISLALEADLALAGQNDDLTGSINYGTLQKDLLFYFLAEPPRSFDGMGRLAEEIAKVAIPKTQPQFTVKVVVAAPKLLLQDAKLSLEIERSGVGDCGWGQNWKWIVSQWRTFVLIGMNPPEREERQVLILDLQLFEKSEAEACSITELISHLSKVHIYFILVFNRLMPFSVDRDYHILDLGKICHRINLDSHEEAFRDLYHGHQGNQTQCSALRRCCGDSDPTQSSIIRRSAGTLYVKPGISFDHTVTHYTHICTIQLNRRFT